MHVVPFRIDGVDITDFSAFRELGPMELRRGRLPPRLGRIQDWIDKRFPIENFGWGVGENDWNLVLSGDDFALDVRGSQRYVCNNAVREVCEKLRAEGLPADVFKMEVLFDFREVTDATGAPQYNVKAVNNFIAKRLSMVRNGSSA